MSEKVATRKSTTVFGLGSGITESDANISGSRLPTCRQVLRCMMFHIQNEGSEKRKKLESAQIVLAKVSHFYEKANIPMISERKACEKIIALLDDNKKLRAIPNDRRSTPHSVEKIKAMEQKLSETFQLWPKNTSKVSTSYATADRSRRIGVKEIAYLKNILRTLNGAQ